MHELAQTIKTKIDNEQKIIDRESVEVTVDWVAVQAELRVKAFKEDYDTICNRILKDHGYTARQDGGRCI